MGPARLWQLLCWWGGGLSRWLSDPGLKKIDYEEVGGITGRHSNESGFGAGAVFTPLHDPFSRTATHGYPQAFPNPHYNRTHVSDGSGELRLRGQGQGMGQAMGYVGDFVHQDVSVSAPSALPRPFHAYESMDDAPSPQNSALIQSDVSSLIMPSPALANPPNRDRISAAFTPVASSSLVHTSASDPTLQIEYGHNSAVELYTQKEQKYQQVMEPQPNAPHPTPVCVDRTPPLASTMLQKNLPLVQKPLQHPNPSLFLHEIGPKVIKDRELLPRPVKIDCVRSPLPPPPPPPPPPPQIPALVPKHDDATTLPMKSDMVLLSLKELSLTTLIGGGAFGQVV